LRPNDASFYFDLGGIYESTGQWKDAMQQYQRATQIDPATTVYRAAMGSVFIKNEMYKEGIDVLEKCSQEEPDNEGYRYLLALAYAESGYHNWTFVPEGGNVSSGYYATTNSQVSEAEQLIEKAERVGVTDSDLKERLREVRENIGTMRKRRFHGNAWAAGGAFVFGLIALFSGDKDLIWGGVFFLLCGGLYIVSCMTPQYILNRRIIAGHGETSASLMAESSGEEGGFLGKVILLLIILCFLPIMIVWNFIKNYAIK